MEPGEVRFDIDHRGPFCRVEATHLPTGLTAEASGPAAGVEVLKAEALHRLERQQAMGGADFSPLLMSAINLHELFRALVGGGFSERQALVMLGTMMAASNTPPPQEGP